jgi:sulfate adenylyltransferase subunit 2
VPVTELTPAARRRSGGNARRALSHRGRHHLHLPGGKPAATAAEIVIETLAADVSERGATRMDDKTSDASMEKRKKDGYF